MTLFKNDVHINEKCPGMNMEYISKMPYYEYRIKVKILEDEAAEENKSSQNQSDQTIQQVSDIQRRMNIKLPDMPKMPDMASLPKISLPSF